MSQDQQQTENKENGKESTASKQENASANKLVLQQGEIKNNDHDPQAGNPESGKEARNGESS